MNEIEKLKEEHMQALTAYEATVHNLNAKIEEMAAEGEELKAVIEAVRAVASQSSGISGWHLNGDIAGWDEILPEINDIETPATDAVIADMRASQLEDAARTIQAQTWDECEGDGIVAAIDALEIMAQKMRSGKGAA